MLKRIDPTDVVLGMFIHKLEGNWFSHPFWRGNFLLTDPAQLERVHASNVPAVIIDTELGIDPDQHAQPAASPITARIKRHGTLPQFRRSLAGMVPAPPPQSKPDAGTPRVLSAPPPEVGRGFGRASAVADRGLKVVAHVFLEMRLGKSIAPATITPVIDSIITSMQSNPFAFNGLMRFRRDNEQVYRHALATSALMIALGRNLRLARFELHAAGLAGLLLDAGVSLFPMDQANRGDPRDLPPEIWQSHVQLGHDFILRSRLPDMIARACLEHHERFDGTGWPHGSGGAALSKLGRMAAICDAYDLFAWGSEGQPGLDPAAVLQQMRADPGAYDPELLSVFETTVGIWPTGSVVALRSGRLAVVIEQSRDAPDRPLIAVFHDPASASPIDDVWINLDNCYGADAIVGPGLIADLPRRDQARASAAMAAAVDRVVPGRNARANAAA
jgi:HD-GYP domain-containing protein (c-di-GMP phosphodiesterase class II)